MSRPGLVEHLPPRDLCGGAAINGQFTAQSEGDSAGFAAVLRRRNIDWSSTAPEFALALSIGSEASRDGEEETFPIHLTPRGSLLRAEPAAADGGHILFSRQAIANSAACFLGAPDYDFRAVVLLNQTLWGDVGSFIKRAQEGHPGSHRIEMGYRALAIFGQIFDALKSPSLANSRVAAVAAYIDQNPFLNITLSSLARSHGFSRSALCRLFGKELKVTPTAYWMRRRMEGVLALVETSPAPLAEIAYVSGFSSQSHLTAAFRERFGRTPGEARKQATALRMSGRAAEAGQTA